MQIENVVKTVPLHGLVQMTNDEYHGAPGVSKTHLDCIATQSELHYWAKYLDPDRDIKPSTPAQLFGQACHIAILEPDSVASNVVCGLEIARRSNADKEEWAAFEAEHADKIIVPSEQYSDMLRLRDAVYRHPMASALLRDGVVEQSFFVNDSETGELIKCRTDFMQNGGGMIVDLKSTDDASPVGFGKSAANYRYDIQVSWYFDVFDQLYGEHPESWVFLAFEKEWPYAIGIYYATPEQIARAYAAARRDFLRIVAAKQASHFPDYGFEIQQLELPGWMRR